MSFRSKLLQSAVHWIINALKSSSGSTGTAVLKSNMKHELFYETSKNELFSIVLIGGHYDIPSLAAGACTLQLDLPCSAASRLNKLCFQTNNNLFTSA